MKRLIAATAALILSAGLASAATTTSRAPTNGQNQTNAQTNAGSTHNVRQQIEDNLTKAGFTDIKIMPESFLIRAKDKNGNPMMMVVNPDSVTEIQAVGMNNSNAKANAQSNNAATGNAAGSTNNSSNAKQQ